MQTEPRAALGVITELDVGHAHARRRRPAGPTSSGPTGRAASRRCSCARRTARPKRGRSGFVAAGYVVIAQGRARTLRLRRGVQKSIPRPDHTEAEDGLRQAWSGPLRSPGATAMWAPWAPPTPAGCSGPWAKTAVPPHLKAMCGLLDSRGETPTWTGGARSDRARRLKWWFTSMAPDLRRPRRLGRRRTDPRGSAPPLGGDRARTLARPESANGRGQTPAAAPRRLREKAG